MAAQKWTVFFASLVLVAFIVETKLTMASEEEFKSKTICEFEKATISCLNGGNIKVVEASFGRHDRSTCSHSAIQTTNCHAENSLSVMQSRCDKKPSCELYADTTVFGDPCPGTYKYLEVKFTCTEPPKSIAICESLKDTISCQDGKIIHVLQASYGRHDLSTCPHEYIKSTNCHAGNSHGIVEATCAYKPSCELYADNSVFGDPCPGTYKYLRVKYQCVESIVICEGNKGTISCLDGKKIHLLQASYGRHDRTTCPSEAIHTTNCHAGNSHAIVETRCQDQASCELDADDSVFGDPCDGTYKYLRVMYKCI